jgi:hypothetical protein
LTILAAQVKTIRLGTITIISTTTIGISGHGTITLTNRMAAINKIGRFDRSEVGLIG